MGKYYPTFLAQSGYVHLTDYCDLVRSKKEVLVNKMVSIRNDEGFLTIVYNTNMIHYMDMAILNQCFTELNDTGNNVSVTNMNDNIVHVVGNYGNHWRYKFEKIDIPMDTRQCEM